jgi:hypothetical protein
MRSRSCGFLSLDIFVAGLAELAVTVKSMGWELAKDKEMTVGYGNYEATLSPLSWHYLTVLSYVAIRSRRRMYISVPVSNGE